MATAGINTPVIAGGAIIVAGAVVYNVFYRVPKIVAKKETEMGSAPVLAE